MNWEVYAIRYGRHERTAQTNFLLPVPDAHEAMPLDYFIWLLRAPDGREIVVDTGFDEETAAARGRTIARNVRDSLKAMGTDAAKVSDVFHLQEREMQFATGRHMCVHAIRLPFEAAHVVAMVKALYADRVVFHDGDGEVAPGVSVHRVGGHSDGLQVVRVQTARGPVVLASDAMHFYANALSGNPFPIIFDLGAMAAGWRAAKKLAGGDDSRVIPGHDPDVRRRFPEVAGQGGEVVALHLPPKD
jgi:glyoxylase-like metal-dependent hydrolase (beta-lactamase superfamily II)